MVVVMMVVVPMVLVLTPATTPAAAPPAAAPTAVPPSAAPAPATPVPTPSSHPSHGLLPRLGRQVSIPGLLEHVATPFCRLLLLLLHLLLLAPVILHIILVPLLALGGCLALQRSGLPLQLLRTIPGARPGVPHQQLQRAGPHHLPACRQDPLRRLPADRGASSTAHLLLLLLGALAGLDSLERL